MQKNGSLGVSLMVRDFMTTFTYCCFVFFKLAVKFQKKCSVIKPGVEAVTIVRKQMPLTAS